MPFEDGHTKSVGNKGGGRKSTKEEFAKNQAIKKAWKKVNDELDDKGVEKIALPIALKDMTVKQDLTTAGKPLAVSDETRLLIETALNRFIDGEPKENTDSRE